MNKPKWRRYGKANSNLNPNPRDDQGLAGAPMNPTTGRIYRGINNLLLGMMQDAAFNGDPRWCSSRQAQARGWQIRKGERGTTVVFYRKLQRWAGEDGETSGISHDGKGEGARPFFMLRASTVFLGGLPAANYRSPRLPSRQSSPYVPYRR